MRSCVVAKPAVDVYLGLGANIGPRRESLRAAVAELRTLLADLRVSALYETAPWGDADQPPFLNAVAAGWARLTPLALLNATQAIEVRLGRVRTGRRWGPRAIDIDILLYGSEVVAEPQLMIPHPHLHERGFVLRPLADLAPSRSIPPDGPQVAELLTITASDDLCRLEPPSWAD